MLGRLIMTITPDYVTAKNHIDSLDFSAIIEKLVTMPGWTRFHAEEAIPVYKNFLLLIKKYGKTQPTTKQERVHLKQAFQSTQSLYFQEFGEYIYELRPGKFVYCLVRTIEIIQSWFTRKPKLSLHYESI